MNNEMLALVPILSDNYNNYTQMYWLQTQYMMSSLTLGIRAPAAIPRDSKTPSRTSRIVIGYMQSKKFSCMHALKKINYYYTIVTFKAKQLLSLFSHLEVALS